jgi:hypothetical protein
MLFAGKKYWRFDESVGHVELDYPRDISMWRGIPGDIDAAFQYIDGKTYFFKGKHFWQFDDMRMKVSDVRPKRIGTHWMQCSPKEVIRDPFEVGRNPEIVNSSRSNHNNFLVVLLLLLLLPFSPQTPY